MIPRIKHAVKVAVAHVLYYLGILRLWQFIALRHKAVVLTYHRVLTADERRRTGSHPGIVVDQNTFSRHMAVLKRSFDVLSIDEFADRLQRGVPFRSSSCLITFDDGWEDTFTRALPVLKSHSLPALIFLPVNYIGEQQLFWREALTNLLVLAVIEGRKDSRRRSHFRQLLEAPGWASVVDLADHDPRPAVIDFISTRNHRPPPAELQQLLSVLAAELGVRMAELGTPDRFINWEQMQLMSTQGLAFGGHGADHHLLTEISASEAEAEIRASKQVLDQKHPVTVPTFSYPNGCWNSDIAQKVKEAGYTLAFTTLKGFVSCVDDPFTLRRLNIHEDVTNSTPMFIAHLLGLF